ncbi:MAG TPA: hypothetical protein VF303_02595 [Candidatus Nanoarchaeia archaeon]
MLSQMRNAINNPFDLRNFYVLFVVAVILLLVPIIVISIISRASLMCKPAQLRFAGDLASGEGKVYEFIYNGSNSCNLQISPKAASNEEVSLWIYKPDKSIEVVDLSTMTSSGSVIKAEGEKGTYRISLRNKNSSKTQYQLRVSVSE